MARTVIYDRGIRQPASTTVRGPTFRGHNATDEADKPGSPPVDDYKDKLIKFVPAEVVAFFAPLASLVQERPTLLVSSAFLGLVATPGYLWISAGKLEPADRPPIHNYVLSTLAFAVWALSASRLGSMVGLGSIESAFMLGVTVFAIPFVDGLFAKRLS